jgi:glycine cleavage system T protein
VSKETAFYARLSALTDEWMDLFGYLAPRVVTEVGAEYRAVRENAGLMDFSMLRKVDLDGAGALDLVNAVVCRDVSALSPGRIAYSALTDERGKMVDDCTVSVLDPSRVRFCGANDQDHGYFAARAGGTAVTVRERTDEVQHLCVQGPRSREILQPLLDRDLSAAALPYYHFLPEARCAGIPVFVTRLGYTAELGYELWVGAEDAVALFDALVAAGRPAGLEVIGMDALDLLRIEGGFIIGGVEYDAETSPYECGLGWTVDLAKPDFQGRAALVDGADAAPLRLCSVVLADGGPAASGAVLTAEEGSAVGLVTQAIASPLLGGRTLGLAKLRRPYHTVGTTLHARVEDRDVVAEVVRHPAYDPERRRARELG